MLYKNGMQIYMILLIYGLKFGIMGICSPLFISISRRYGIGICAILSNILRIINSYIILSGNYNNIILIIIIMSLPGALSNLIGDAVSSKHIEKSHRGKYNSIINIIKILAEAIASVIVSIGLITKNHNYIYTIILIFFALDSLFTCLVSYKPKLKNNYTFKNTIKYIINTKSTFKTIYSLRAFHIIERLFLPLYIYIAIQDFQLFSTIIIVSIITQILPVVIIGIITDKNVNNSNNIVSVLKLTITSIFLIAKSKFSISLNKTVNDNLSKAYETSVQTSIQNIMIKTHGDKLFLSTIGQMSLCFSEIIVLLILSILAKFIGIQIFKFIFILSIMATIIINLNINLSEKE